MPSSLCSGLGAAAAGSEPVADDPGVGDDHDGAGDEGGARQVQARRGRRTVPARQSHAGGGQGYEHNEHIVFPEDQYS